MKTASSLLALLLPATMLFSACGPGDAPPATPSTTPTTEPQTEAPATAPASSPSTATTQTRWRCGELLVAASFPEGRVDLSFSGRTLQLPIARSGSGARYADDKGSEFWNKGDQAMLTLAGEEKRDCTITQHTSPWQDAKARGAVFRAIGQEPGWWVEIGSGDSPPLHTELDYGERKIDIAHTQGISSTPGYGGEMEDGTDVVLRTKQEPCSDAMSGERFQTSAELTVGDKVYEGCGAYLDR